jgi:hypothetical protein
MRKRNAQRFLPAFGSPAALLPYASARLSALAPRSQAPSVRYQTLRSVSDHHVFVVCRDGAFYEIVPSEVRKQGPWQGQHHGEIDKLKAEYRLALAKDGYGLVKCELAVFKPEV